MNYNKYLKTKHWQEVRTEKLERHSCCQFCKSFSKLNIHHRNYKCLWKEKPGQLVTLCSSCHSLWHWQYGNKKMKHKLTLRIRRLIENGVNKKKAIQLCTMGLAYKRVKEYFSSCKKPTFKEVGFLCLE